MPGRKYFCAYYSMLESIEPLTDEEVGRLFKALLTYSSTGSAPELPGNERFIFPGMRAQIDRDNERYNKRCKKNSENVKKRWNDTNVCDCIRTYTNDTKEKEKEKEKKKENITPFPPSSGEYGTMDWMKGLEHDSGTV